jgi:hypothetical protein
MKKSKTLSLITLALLLAALSAAAGPKFAAEPGIPEGKALIYIYFPPSYYPTRVAATVMANQQPVTTLKAGCYFPYITAPGSIDFWSSQSSEPSVRYITHVILDVEADREYFLHVGADMFAISFKWCPGKGLCRKSPPAA